MAKLELIDNGIALNTHEEISCFLKTEGIQFGTFDLSERAKAFSLEERLSEQDRQALLSDYAHLSEHYGQSDGFRQDIIFLHPGFEHYAFLVQKFGALHFHYENEYWYMFGGTGHFGYLGTTGLRFMLHLDPGEYVSVPEGRWQWWASNVEEAFKAMRFFNTNNQFKAPDLSAVCQDLQQNAATSCPSSESESA